MRKYYYFCITDSFKQIQFYFLQNEVSHFPAFVGYFRNCWNLYISSACSFFFNSQQILWKIGYENNLQNFTFYLSWSNLYPKEAEHVLIFLFFFHQWRLRSGTMRLLLMVWVSKLFWNPPTNPLVPELLQALQHSGILISMRDMALYHTFSYLLRTVSVYGTKRSPC